MRRTLTIVVLAVVGLASTGCTAGLGLYEMANANKILKPVYASPLDTPVEVKREE